MSYKIPREQLPRELQFYAEGTKDFPAGDFTQIEIQSAMKYRQTFFRRIQVYKPGLQYQWQDYQKLMWQEIVAYAKRVLRKKVFAKWDSLTGHNSRLGTIFQAEKCRLLKNSGPISLAKRERLIKLAKQSALMTAIMDPRTLGLLEEAVVGKAFYGIPSKVHYHNY